MERTNTGVLQDEGGIVTFFKVRQVNTYLTIYISAIIYTKFSNI